MATGFPGTGVRLTMGSDIVLIFQWVKLGATSVVGVFGLALIFLQVPQGEVLRNYRLCRRYLGGAYLLFMGVNLLGYLIRTGTRFHDVDIHRTLTLVVASYQVFLLPIALVTLVNADYLDRPRRFLPLVPLVIFSFLALGTLVFPWPEEVEKLILGGYFIFFLGQLASSTRTLILEGRRFRTRLDSVFSGRAPENLRWVTTMGLLSNGCGVLALLMILVPSWAVALPVFSAIAVLYGILGIRYLNYPYAFRLVASLVHPAPENPPAGGAPSLERAEVEKLEARVKNSIEEGGLFLDPGLTIDQLAGKVGLRPALLSQLLNGRPGRNFRKFVNGYRVEKARELLISFPDKSVLEIAFDCGFNSKSSFNLAFKIETGQSPREWRESVTGGGAGSPSLQRR